jgi:hypothetical protein
MPVAKTKENIMKKTLIAALLALAPAVAAAADFSLARAAAADIKGAAAPVSAPALVTLDASNKGEDNTQGYLSFVNWGLYQPTKSAAIVVYGPVARNLYETMNRAKFRAAPANLASMHPREVTRQNCEARVGRHMVCLRIPKMTSDALVLTNGRPTYTADSYQCDIYVSDSGTMEFSTAQ